MSTILIILTILGVIVVSISFYIFVHREDMQKGEISAWFKRLLY